MQKPQPKVDEQKLKEVRDKSTDEGLKKSIDEKLKQVQTGKPVKK